VIVCQWLATGQWFSPGTPIKSFGEEVADSARKFGVTIQQIEGGVQLLQSPDGTTSTQRVG
jgi:hypothetical protein